ncbi:hypothetical protein GGI35DRAFT_213018 [Trichoderma velutinum]
MAVSAMSMVLARGWSTSSDHPRTADASHRRRFSRPLAWPSEDRRLVLNIDGPFRSIYPYRVACAEAGSEDLNRGTENRLWDLPGESVCAYPESDMSWLFFAAFRTSVNYRYGGTDKNDRRIQEVLSIKRGRFLDQQHGQ